MTVGGGKVTAVNSAAPNAGTIPAPERFVPIEGLFALILDAITQHAAYIEVSYDETYGYPVELFIDYNERMAGRRRPVHDKQLHSPVTAAIGEP